jgi:hypothetical protein
VDSFIEAAAHALRNQAQSPRCRALLMCYASP